MENELEAVVEVANTISVGTFIIKKLQELAEYNRFTLDEAAEVLIHEALSARRNIVISDLALCHDQHRARDRFI